MGNHLEFTGTEDFLNKTPLAQTLSSTTNKWDLMKLRSFCTANNTINRTKQQTTTEWENIFTNYISNRRLISKIYKELKKPDTKKTTQFENGYRSTVPSSVIIREASFFSNENKYRNPQSDREGMS